jgi:Pao retrotransposon peptidase.
VIFLKILLQKIWLLKSGWDEPLPSDLLSEWQTFVKQVPCITDLKIPRYISDVNSISFEIIGFSDASSVAMAAVVYLRVQLPDGQVQVNLLRAKLKVAPTKPVTIPRLELSAADLLIKIIDTLTSFSNSIKIAGIT